MSVRHGPWPVDGQLPRRNSLAPFDTFSPAKWQGTEPPPYDWMVDGCFLRGTVAMLSGDGGLGKSLLMQQLCTAAAIGKPWLGLETQTCKTFAMFCEDDEDELHRRQHAINRHYGCDGADLDNVDYAARVGMENILVEFDRRTDEPKYLPFFDQLRHKVLELGAQLIVLDTLADVFAGNEIVKNQVRRFISALRKLAMEAHGVVILTAHPSLTGMSSGTGLSGNVAWNNTVRSRLYLTRVRNGQQEGEEEDTNERYLRTMKNNQGPYGGKIKLRWERGVFSPVDGVSGGVAGVVETLQIDNTLLDAARYLVKRGTRVATDPMARTSLVNLAKVLPSCREYRRGDIEASQMRLIERGRLVSIEMGPPSRRYAFLRPSEMTYQGEDQGGSQAPSQPSQGGLSV